VIGFCNAIQVLLRRTLQRSVILLGFFVSRQSLVVSK